jgi:alkylhydroperoxidase/carboxymuconolactone decarboxylase family protein YurZ
VSGIADRFARFRAATAAALLDRDGATPSATRRAIANGAPPADLKTLVDKIRSRAYTVTDADVDALRRQYTEDQLFEIIVSAAFGAASERLAAARKALEDA